MRGTLAKANEDRPMAGIAMVLFANLTFSCLDTSAKWLVLAGIPALQIGFMRYAVHSVFSVGMVARKGGGWSSFGSDQLGLVVLRGVLLMISTLCNFVALRYIPLTLTATIMFSAPMIVTALSGPVLGERVGPWRWGAILVGFIGVMVAIRPFDAEFHWAAFVALAGAAAYSGYQLLTRMLAGKVSSEPMQLYGGMVGTIALLPFAILTWQSPETPLDWTLLCIVGLFGWFGHELLTRAYGFADASSLTPFTYVMIIYLGVWSYAVFDQPPTVATMFGAAIVITAGLVIWVRERQAAKAREMLRAGVATDPPGMG
jgi:drug/metabolite transporter (DMT)-like permease